MEMRTVGMIPARMGSKRIPNKNIKELNSIPIIVRTLRNMQASKVFDEIIVSTDSETIMEMVIQEGAICDGLRPLNLADDLTPVLPVVHHEINKYNLQKTPHVILGCIFPTSVFLRKEDYEGAFAKFLDSMNPPTFLISASKFVHPIDRAMSINTNGKLVPINIDKFKNRTQDLPVTYYDCGQFYFATVDNWIKRDQDKIALDFIVLNQDRLFDIDTLEDWERAERKFATLR